MTRKPAQATPKAKSPPDTVSASVDPLKEEIARQLGPLVQQNVREEAVQRVLSIFYQESFAGPIAHPRHLAAYEQILPGSAERIMRMAEKAQEHNAAMERKLVDAEIADTRRGMLFGFVALLILLALATMFGLMGQPVMAGLFLTATLLSAVPVFVNGRHKT